MKRLTQEQRAKLENLSDEELKKYAAKYRRYISGSLREVRERIQKALANPDSELATTEEIAEYNFAVAAAGRENTLRRARKEGRPAGRKENKDPDWTPEQLEELKEKHDAWVNKYGRAQNAPIRATMEALQTQPRESLDPPTRIELEQYEDLLDARRTFDRWRGRERWKRRQQMQQNMLEEGAVADTASCSERSLLDYYHEKFRQYQKEYVGTPAARERARQAQDPQAPPEERDRFKRLQQFANRYRRLQHRLKMPAETEVEMEFDLSLADYIPQLEHLRVNHNMFLQFFGGKHRAGWRKALLARTDPDEAAVELFHELQPDYLEFKRVYGQAWRKARKCVDSEDNKVKEIVKGGQPRWFRRLVDPNVNRRIIKPQANDQDRGNVQDQQHQGPKQPNKLVLEQPSIGLLRMVSSPPPSKEGFQSSGKGSATTTSSEFDSHRPAQWRSSLHAWVEKGTAFTKDLMKALSPPIGEKLPTGGTRPSPRFRASGRPRMLRF